tara:strand:+ start:38 stop:1009 length:972 start_codon:yes stop_codon:yes gene_type:complete
MSHEIEEINGAFQMAYAGEKPWHGLGTSVGNDLLPAEMMQVAGLDWTVHKEDLVTSAGHPIPDKKGLVRSSDNKVLDIVGKDWNPVQNSTAFSFFDEFIREGGGMQMHTAGSLRGGQIVFALAKVDDSFELFGGDKVESYLLFTNPHKFGRAIDVRFTPIRVVCDNTLAFSLSQHDKNVVKLNHTKEFRAEDVKEMMGIASFKLNKYKEMAEFLGSRLYSTDKVVQYFDELFPTHSKKERNGSIVQSYELSTPAKRCMGLLETQPGSNFARNSYWQAFNAVTFFTDHERGHTADSRLQSAWYGQSRNLKFNALQKAIEYAEAV